MTERIYAQPCVCARARVCTRVYARASGAYVWVHMCGNNDIHGNCVTRRPLGQAQTGGDYSWISMAIWIIYWTVSSDTTSQNHVIYWHPRPSSRPLVLLAVRTPCAGTNPWCPVYPLSPLIRIGASAGTVKNVYSLSITPLSHPCHPSAVPLIQHRVRAPR